MAPPPTRLPTQILLIATALALWPLLPTPSLSALVPLYLGAWLAFELARIGPRGLVIEQPRRGVALLALLLLVAPLVAAYRSHRAIAAEDDLRGGLTGLRHRLRLEALPSIAPGVVFADHPQSFYAHAPRREVLTLELGEGVDPLPATPLGEGLFRIDYDPRTSGVPTSERASLEATLVADGVRYRRRLDLVKPAAHPRWLASDPAGGYAATVSEETDELFVLSRNDLLHRLDVADGPSDVAFVTREHPGDTLVVAHRYSPTLEVRDTQSGARVRHVALPPMQHRLAVSPDGSMLAVAMHGPEPGVQLLALPAVEPTTFVSTPFAPDWLAFGPEPNVLVLSSLATRALHKWRSEADGWHETEILPLGRPVVTLTRTHDGESVVVAVTDYRPSGETHRGNHFIQDQLLFVDVGPWRLREQVLTARRTPSQSSPGNVDQGISPMGLATRADGSLLVAFAGSDEVWQLEPDKPRPWWVTGGLDLDLIAPHGVADLGEGVWAASSPAGGALALYRRNGEMIRFLGVAPPDDELAADGEGSLDQQTLAIRAGERAFYEGTRAGLSCQSCHLHGASDESPHDIGQGPLLPTLTVRGIGGTAPYLRDGSFARVRDLNDHLSEGLYRGYARYSENRREQLETFVETLPRPVNPARFATRDLERERAGAAAFVRARCALCHTFPALTNLGQHPVRALFPDYGADLAATIRLDTPSLTGSHGRTHFLQDGRAHDLHEVLGEHNISNRHGNTAALDAEQRADLVHFLLSL